MRRRVLDTTRALCRTRRAAVRPGEVHGAMQKAGEVVDTGTVTRALDSLARTGDLRVDGLVFGLRSGGRRLYWPAGWAAARGTPQTSPMDQIHAMIRQHPLWGRGAPFRARELVAYAEKASDLPRAGSRGSRAKAVERAVASMSWSTVFRSLRNLERRRCPLIRRTTDERGQVRWMLLGASGEPHATADHLIPAQVTATAPAVLIQPVAGPRVQRPPRVLALAGVSRRRLDALMARVITRAGRAVVSRRELLASVAPGASRDAVQRLLRWLLDRFGRHQSHRATTVPAPLPLAVLGWLDGDCYFARWQHAETAAQGLQGLEALVRLRVCAVYARVTVAYRAAPASAGGSDRALVAAVRSIDHTAALERIAEVEAALNRIDPFDAVRGPSRLSAGPLSGRRRVAQSAETVGGDTTWWATQCAAARTELHAIRTSLARGGPAGRSVSVGAADGDRPTSAEHANWVTANEISRLLSGLLGVAPLPPVSLRRFLAASPIWRTWDRGQPIGATTVVDSAEGTRGTPRSVHRDRGREPVRWDRTDALLWYGQDAGGRHTRLALRTAWRLVGWGRPTVAVLEALVQHQRPAIALGAMAFAACHVENAHDFARVVGQCSLTDPRAGTRGEPLSVQPEAVHPHRSAPGGSVETATWWPWLSAWVAATRALCHPFDGLADTRIAANARRALTGPWRR